MKKLYLSILFLLAGVGSVFSQDVEQAVRERLQAFFQTYIPVNVNIGTCRLLSFFPFLYVLGISSLMECPSVKTVMSK